MSLNAAELAKSNIYWPVTRWGKYYDTKGLWQFGNQFRNEDLSQITQDHEMIEFIVNSRKRKHHIILSAESFDQMNTAAVAALKNLLQGFEMQVIFAYRNPISMMVSTHYELNKHPEHFSESFATYLMSALHHLPQHLQVLSMLDTFSNVVGVDRMHIIDLAGASADHVDVTYVMVCELMNVCCNNRAMFTAPTERNAGSSLVHMQVFSYLNAYVKLNKPASCRACEKPSISDQYARFAAMVEAKAVPRKPFPLLVSSLHLLAPYAKEVDAALRAKYSTRILHGNATANYEVIDHGIAVEDLDVEEFTTQAYWRDWLEKVYQWAVAEKLLCGCS
jgi:hypothetical protein